MQGKSLRKPITKAAQTKAFTPAPTGQRPAKNLPSKTDFKHLRYNLAIFFTQPSMMSDNPNDEYDSPWKEAVEHHFPEFMAFYFPKAHDQIDWTQEHVFLDQELQAVVQDAELGKRFVDKLVRITLNNGQEDWIYIHIEVQGTPQAEFSERMFVYNYRIFDRYRKPIASMAVLADEQESWRPASFEREILDCRIGFHFPIVKLLDYAQDESSLEQSSNPFALVTLANLWTQKTRNEMSSRFAAKWKLIQLLYQRDWDKQRIIDLFRVLDWMMWLPEDFSQKLEQNIDKLEEEKRMQYITSIERSGIKKGLEQGRQEGRQEGRKEGVEEGLHTAASTTLLRLLNRKFGEIPPAARNKIEHASLENLEHWTDQILDAKSIDDIFVSTDLKH